MVSSDLTALAARRTLILKSSLRKRADAGTFAMGGGKGCEVVLESVVLAWFRLASENIFLAGGIQGPAHQRRYAHSRAGGRTWAY